MARSRRSVRGRATGPLVWSCVADLDAICRTWAARRFGEDESQIASVHFEMDEQPDFSELTPGWKNLVVILRMANGFKRKHTIEDDDVTEVIRELVAEAASLEGG